MHKERYWPQNWPLVKNLQFWFNLDQILSNWLSHLCDLLTKFHENWTKIVDFSLIANFEASTVLFASVFIYLHKIFCAKKVHWMNWVLFTLTYKSLTCEACKFCVDGRLIWISTTFAGGIVATISLSSTRYLWFLQCFKSRESFYV